MAHLSGCHIPEHLYYDVVNHIWYETLGAARIRMGMTSVAAGLASNRIFAFTPKRPGRPFEKGRSFATIESGKWVGPARAAFDGVVIEANDDLIDRPWLLARDPYGAAWMIIAEPSVPDPLADLLTGASAIASYEVWIRDNNFAGCPDPAP